MAALERAFSHDIASPQKSTENYPEKTKKNCFDTKKKTVKIKNAATSQSQRRNGCQKRGET
jgi:hypothetical protein